MTDFGQLLFETAKACQGRSCVVLAEVLRVKVRAWADEQSNPDLTFNAGIAEPWTVADESARP